MSDTLVGTRVSETFGQLLHVPDGVTSTAKAVRDGDGTATPLKLSTTEVVSDFTPTAATHVTNKAYVDAIAQGLSFKTNAKAATTANITLSGAQTIDGVSCVAGNRVLVKDQTLPAQNGIYVVAAGAWSRATDMDTWAEVNAAVCRVEQGTSGYNTSWVASGASGGTLGTTSIVWYLLNSDRGVSTAATYATMTALTEAQGAVVGNVIQTIAREANDTVYGGAGLWLVKSGTTTANYGTKLNHDTLSVYFERLITSDVTPQMFLGWSTGNYTTALQRWIDFCGTPTASGFEYGRTGRLPDGLYFATNLTLTGQPRLYGNKGAVIQAISGGDATYFFAAESWLTAASQYPGGSFGLYGFVVDANNLKDITFVNRNYSSETHGMIFTGGRVQNYKFSSNAKDGTAMNGAFFPPENSVQRCKFAVGAATPDYQLTLGGNFADWVIHDNIFEHATIAVVDFTGIGGTFTENHMYTPFGHPATGESMIIRSPNVSFNCEDNYVEGGVKILEAGIPAVTFGIGTVGGRILMDFTGSADQHFEVILRGTHVNGDPADMTSATGFVANNSANAKHKLIAKGCVFRVQYPFRGTGVVMSENSWSNYDQMMCNGVQPASATPVNAPVYDSVQLGVSKAKVVSPSDGVMTLLNDAGNDFTRLQFGGTGNNRPALERSNAAFVAKLADGSDYTFFVAKITTHNAYTAGAPTPTGYLTLYDAGGVAYKVPAELL